MTRAVRKVGTLPEGGSVGRDRTRPEGWVITVPETWYEFDVRPQTRDGSIRDVVRKRIGEIPALAPHRSELVRILRRLAREAWDSGAQYCGAMAEGLGEDTPLTASVTVSAKAAPSDGGPPNTDPVFITTMLSSKAARGDDDTWRKVDVVTLPGAGQAARSWGIEDIELPGGDRRSVRVVTMQTIVPVPATDQVALITCGSPELGLVNEFHDLFDAITSTFRFITDMTPPASPDERASASSSQTAV